MCFAPSFLRSRGGAVTQIRKSNYRRAVARADSPLAAFSQPSLQVPGAGLAQGNPTDNVKLFWHHIICDYVFM